MMIKKAITTTLENFKQFDRYEKFMSDSTQTEFAQSQIPFYFAVKAFPRALCYLASMVEESKIRLSVAENIWEEHGNGDESVFHINTFHDYLTAIAGNDYPLSHNPWIEEWIQSWFNEKDVHALACQLAAIEYLYAPISAKLAEHIATLSLNNEQGHYSKHAVLDWNHGKDLFEIALYYDDSENYEKTFELFTQAQEAFIAVFNGMIVFTKQEVSDIAEDPIAFYYLREDGDVALRTLERLDNRDSLNIITICSGGENILCYLNLKKKMDIIVLDMNQNQYQLFLDKLSDLQNNQLITELSQGKFERVFANLRDRFAKKEQNHFVNTGEISVEKLHFAVQDIFSRENLAIIFTDNAVKYTQKDFAEHFFRVFSSKFESGSFGEQNIYNILAGKPFEHKDCQDLYLDNKNIMPIIHYINGADIFDHITFENGQKADMIDLSNIGDWIDSVVLQLLVQRAYEELNNGGLLIIRKLLGDYDLQQVLKNAGFITNIESDTSHFYEEVIIGQKHE